MSPDNAHPPDEDLALRSIMGGSAPPIRSGTTHDGSAVVAPGDLPVWFAKQGLVLLRQSEFAKALEYYKSLAEQQPDQPEGWFGLAGTCIGTGDYKNAAQFLARGLELVDMFPVGALASEARPGDPRMFVELAKRLADLETHKTLTAAMFVLDECMKTPTVPTRIYHKANDLKLKYRDWLDVLGKPELAAMKRKAETTESLASIGRVLLILLVVLGVGYGGWRGYHSFRASALVNAGLLDFVEAAHMEALGSGTLNASKNVADPYELYVKAYNKFRNATLINPQHFMAHYMMARSAQAAVERARSSKLAVKVPDQAVSQLAASAKKAREKAKGLDPSGSQTREADAEVSRMLKQ